MESVLTALAILAGSASVIGMALLVLWIINRVTLGRPATPEELAKYERQYQERLAYPKWDEIERHFGRAIPAALRALFADSKRRGKTCFYVISSTEDDEHYIQRFEPADLKTLEECWIPMEEQRLPFASDDFDNFYFIEMGNNWRDGSPVYYYDHDGGGVSEVSESLETFLSWRTRPDSRYPA